MEGSLTANLGDGDDTLSIDSNGPTNTGIVLNDGSKATFGPVRTGVFMDVSGGDGDDKLALRNVKANGYLAFTAGAGNDTFTQVGTALATNRIGGALTLNMGSGADNVGIQAVDVRGDLLVNDESGGIAQVRIDRARVIGDARINTPNLADDISLGVADIASAVVANRLAITANQGYDQIKLQNVDVQDLIIHGGLGNNTVSLTHVSANETLTITGNEGRDNISLNVVFTDFLTIRTWRGDDKITLNQVAAADAFFDLFDGADELVIDDSIFSRLTAKFGFDDDKLTFGELTVVGTATFDGGDGLNTSTNLGGNSIGRLRMINI
jgi:hypothetical protein